MSLDIADWKYRRAVLRGLIEAHPEVENEIREQATRMRTDGYGWFVDGFDRESVSEILSQVEELGVSATEKDFLELASELPGPLEVGDAWSARLPQREGLQAELLELAARALWRKLLPEEVSIETAADELEEILLRVICQKAQEGESALLVLQKFVGFSEGDERVAQALADELPIRIWPWILRAYRDASEEATPEEWLSVGESLLPVFPSVSVLRAVVGRFAAVHDRPAVAREWLEQSLENGGGELSFVLIEAARGFAALKEETTAFTLVEKALVLAEDDGDDADAAAVMVELCASAGKETEAEERIHQGRKRRMERTQARRKQRRRLDKKGKKRRR